MGPIEQYPTLRAGRARLRKLDEAARQERVARLNAWRRTCAWWLSVRFLKWGHWLEQYALLTKPSPASSDIEGSV